MLREIYVLKESNIIYYRQFGTAIPWESVSLKIYYYVNALKESTEEKIYIENINNYKICYNFFKKLKLLFIFITDIKDDEKLIESQLERARKEFIDLFPEQLIISEVSPENFNAFHIISDLIHKEMRPKISIVGFSGVGKTTTTKLIKADDIPIEHVPTMSCEVSTIKIGKLFFHLWDFAGQDHFSFLWPNFIVGSDAVILITDSSLNNIDKSKYFMDLTKNEVPTAKFAVIANKQDLPDVLTPEEIASMLDIPKVYGMIAVDTENRGKMISIIAEVLEISSQLSPLIKPLIDRDKIVDKAQEALMKGELEKAAEYFEAIAKYSMDLSEDKIAQEFFERAKTIREAISSDKKDKDKDEVTKDEETRDEESEINLDEKKMSPEALATYKLLAKIIPKIQAETKDSVKPPAKPIANTSEETNTNQKIKETQDVSPKEEINIPEPSKLTPSKNNVKENKTDNEIINQETENDDQETEINREEIINRINDLENKLLSLENEFTQVQTEFSENIITEQHFKEKKFTLLKEKSQLRKEINELKLSIMDK